jgi:hypothetical protein
LCKAIWAIPVNRVVDMKIIIRKKFRAEEEEDGCAFVYFV